MNTAKRIADYYIKCFEKWGYIAPADFCQPTEPEIFDTTAGVIASCGFLEIASHLSDDERKKYVDSAINIIVETEKNFVIGMGMKTRYYSMELRHILEEYIFQ